MAWNGAGVFSRIHNWAADALAGIKILASRHDAEDDNITTGINNCLTKNGENSPSANLPMGGFKHTNVANATARDSYASAGQVQDGSLVYAVDTGAADAYVISLSPAITAYAAGQRFTFKATNANTGASTLNINTLGVKTIKKNSSVNLAVNDIIADQIVEVEYDGTNFQMLSQLGTQDNEFTTGDVKLTYKTTADSGYVMADDGSIGNASSGASNRANADTEDLYTLFWDNMTDSECPVSSGRGANAAADFAANKTLTIPLTLGRALAIAGTGSGLTARTLGDTVGEEDHTPTEAETAAHTHTERKSSTTATTPGSYMRSTNDPVSEGNSSTNTASTGSSTAFNVMQPTSFINIMVKL